MSRVILEGITIEWDERDAYRRVDGREERFSPPPPLYRVKMDLLADAHFIDRLREFFHAQGAEQAGARVPRIGNLPLLPPAPEGEIVHKAEIVDEPPRPRQRSRR